MIRSLNIWLAALTWVAAMWVTNGGEAQDAKRVAIMKFQGPSAAAFQAQVSAALKQRKEVELVPATEVQSTANRLGNGLSSDSDFREIGEALELSAFIHGTVEKKGRNLEATVRVRDASSGAVVHEETWTRRRSQVKTLKPVVWSALGPAIRETSPPAPKAKTKPKPPPIEEDEDEEEPIARPKPRPTPRASEERERPPRVEEEPEERSRRAGGKSALHPALVLAAGPRLMWRNLEYEGDTNFNDYTNAAGKPAVNLSLHVDYFPGAHSSAAWYSDLGIEFGFDYALGLKSKQENRELGTTAYDLVIGAVYRFPLDTFVPFLRLGYLKQVFDVDVSEMTFLPSLDYSALRFGFGTAVNIVESFALDASFNYLFVLGTGELEEPKFGEDVSTKGWEAGAGALLRFKEVYGLRLALDYRRYKYDFGLSDSDMIQRLPKSGTDGYLRLGLYFVYSLPGVATN